MFGFSAFSQVPFSSLGNTGNIYIDTVVENFIIIDTIIGRGWFIINDNQTITWNAISNNQTITWNAISNNQTITWQNIGNDSTPNWTIIDNGQ
jgi:hypothetical protein